MSRRPDGVSGPPARHASLAGAPVEGMAVAAIICAAGSSTRMGGIKKEYLPLPNNPSGLTVLGAVVRSFMLLSEVRTIVIAVPRGDPATGERAARNAIPPAALNRKGGPSIHFVAGGKNRRASVFNALSALPKIFPAGEDAKNYVLIHDGARPWISPRFVRRVIAELQKFPAVVPVLPLSETPKETTLPLDNAFFRGKSAFPVYVKTHLKRSCLGMAQTPQGFSYPEILAAHEMAAEHERIIGGEFTDDAEIWGAFHGSVAVIPGDAKNRKITYPEDLV
ncbi:MAG: 2-C-methyl-D-erythritol 4-phosphate cytidylyltransferase [Treponema sp.]|nr:2-C-methyl-D-erythritol 4-phosphate cytidylyltransferase [Treponema sp.]